MHPVKNGGITEVLTSTSLIPLRDLIAKAREQKSQVEMDLEEARDEETTQLCELRRRKGSLFRWFYKKRIAELEAALPVTQAEVERLSNWEENTKVVVTFEAGDAAQRAYSSMVRTSAGSRWATIFRRTRCCSASKCCWCAPCWFPICCAARSSAKHKAGSA